jgi:hypothetical protein
MDDFKKMEDFVDHVREYVHVRVDEARLGAADRISGVLSSLITAGVIAAVIFIAFVFVFIAGALLVSYLLNDFMLGFLLMGAFLGFIALCIWWGRGRLIRIPITNVILDELMKSKSENESHEKN